MSTPFETLEWRWVPVYQQTDPQDPTTLTLAPGPISYAVFKDGGRAVTYTPAVVRQGLFGIVLSGLTAGVWRVWAKPTSAPDAPVVDCGTFTLK